MRGTLDGPLLAEGCVKTWVNFELGGRAAPPHHERIAYSAM
jgi:hypothetical protein